MNITFRKSDYIKLIVICSISIALDLFFYRYLKSTSVGSRISFKQFIQQEAINKAKIYNNLKDLNTKIQEEKIETIVEYGLHQFVTQFIRKISSVDNEIHKEFFN